MLRKCSNIALSVACMLFGLNAFANTLATNSCQSCHDTTPNYTPETVHSVHIGKLPRPEANCSSCHNVETNNTSSVFNNPSVQGCFSCHTPNISHKNVSGNCQICHSAESIKNTHMGKYENAKSKNERGLLNVRVESTKLVTEDSGKYALIGFSLRDKDGNKVSAPGEDPANAPWIVNLQLYVNWGVSVDFLSSRGYTIYVKSNKKDITQQGLGKTPKGERERTPLHSAKDSVYYYKVGPIITSDSISGDLSKDFGLISDRLIFCFGNDGNLLACSDKASKKNAGYNHRVFFDENGITTDPQKKRPTIVSNQKCGSCHGYDKVNDTTEAGCRSCHSQPTKKNKLYADTTCYSGHDDENGKHIRAWAPRVLTNRALPAFLSSTSDMVDPCLECHNPNTPPTQAIRERHTVKGDSDYIEQLVLTHPDYKMWIHSLHANTRSTQKELDAARRVSYPASTSNCNKCHEKDSFNLERLAKHGRPLALDLNYDSDSNAHPAIDIKVNAYVSPMSATCFACHGKTEVNGESVVNKEVRKHMEQFGGRFGVSQDKLVKEQCNLCHTTANIKKAHGL